MYETAWDVSRPADLVAPGPRFDESWKKIITKSRDKSQTFFEIIPIFFHKWMRAGLPWKQEIANL